MLSENEDEEYSDTQETLFSTESLSVAEPFKMHVFLRIRPTSTPTENESNSDVYSIADPSTLLVKHFNSSESARRLVFSKSNENVSRRKFTFSKIFNQDIDQSQFFNEAIKPSVIDFLNNQSSTVISYGTADAGKTYTLFGSAEQPGVIPRTIELIYSSLNCTLTPWYKPERCGSVINLDECDRTLETEAREKLLSCRIIDKSLYEEAYEALENSEMDKNRDIFKDSMYSVWISFVEIYNDAIFDLLEFDEDGKNMQLKLSIDKHGDTYIQGLRSVCATTGLEAYEILNAGQMKLNTESTSTYKSSRSHSIFTIKLLKYERDSEPSQVKVSSITFCDLAGTGKIQKIASNSKEFKESTSINTSLLALGRCLKVIANGHSRQSTGPFRDSKLTRLFQRSLCGKENVILLINLNPTLELFAETQSVLNFASTAMKLASEFGKEDKRLVDCHRSVSSPKLPESRLPLRIKSGSARDYEIDDIILKNKQLLAEIKELKSLKLKKEFQIRKELADSYTKQLNELEENWKNRMLAMEEEKESFLKFSVSQVENYYKGKLEEFTTRKRKRIDRGDYEEHLDSDMHESENSIFSSKIVSIKKSLESMKNENKLLNTQKNQQAFELSLIKSSLKKLVESINTEDEKLDSCIEFNNLKVEKADSEVSLDDDVTSYLIVIKDLIRKSLESKICLNDMKREKARYNKEVQCNPNNSVISEFYREIRELLDPNFVSLPEIDDSFDASNNTQSYINDVVNDSSFTMLSKLKELISDNVSKTIKLEVENIEKSDQLNILENRVEQQNIEILQLKEKYEEIECARLSLTKEIEELKLKLKSKEYFKNVELVMVESENSSTDKIREIAFREHEFTPRHSLDNNCRLSLFESDSEKIESRAVRSSSDSSRNDSGVGSSVESAVCKETDEKCCQTNIYHEDNNHSFQERLMQLKLDYKQMKAQHIQESLRVTELSQELDHIREAMTRLKESTCMKERAIIEYQSKLSSNKTEIEKLKNEKRDLETKCDELSRGLKEANKEYEKKLTESQVKLKVQEESENKAAKCLEDYWQKSVNLGSELSLVYSQLEETSIKCFKEHVLKIDKLEKELNERKISAHSLENKIDEYEKDRTGMNDLSEKVNDFEELLDKMKKEKSDLHNLILERSVILAETEEKLTNLATKIEERDEQVMELKSQVATIIKTNLSNSRKAKELGKEVARLMEKICNMNEDIIQSEESRKELERTSHKEICNLRARLTIYEENAELLNLICDSNENKQSEVDKLKLKLLEKEKELEFFKKNRNATIQRYECLVRQLQDALKMGNHHSSKLKKFFTHKQKYFVNDLKENITCKVHGSEPQICDWKSLSDEHSYLLSYSSEHTNIEHSSSTESSAETPASKEEPSRLMPDFDEKFLETRHKTCSKNHHVPCKDLGLSSGFDNSVGTEYFSHITEHVSMTPKIDEHTKFELRHRKSHKVFN